MSATSLTALPWELELVFCFYNTPEAEELIKKMCHRRLWFWRLKIQVHGINSAESPPSCITSGWHRGGTTDIILPDIV